MTNPLYFSGYIIPIARRLRFILIICARFFVILFRWRKGIKLLHLTYAKKHQFDNSYLIIRYRFRNALWYNFKTLTKTTEKEIIILNLTNLPEKSVELIVVGFLRRKVFHISVTPENKLENKSFKIYVNGVRDIEHFNREIILRNIKKIPELPAIELQHSKIQIKQLSYNQTDFL